MAGFTYLRTEWYPDGRRLVFVAEQPGRPLSAYVQDLAGGAPTRLEVDLGPFGERLRTRTTLLVSPDAKWFTGTAGPPTLMPLEVDGGHRSRSL